MDKIINKIKKLNQPVLYETGGNNEFISKNIFALTGYYAEEIIVNRDLFPGLINPEDYIETNFKVKNWHKQGETGSLIMTFRLRVAEGEMIWIEDHLSGRIENNKKYMQGIMININNEKINETELIQLKHQISLTDPKDKDKLTEITEKLDVLKNNKEKRKIIVENILDDMKKANINFHNLPLDFLNAK